MLVAITPDYTLNQYKYTVKEFTGFCMFTIMTTVQGSENVKWHRLRGPARAPKRANTVAVHYIPITVIVFSTPLKKETNVTQFSVVTVIYCKVTQFSVVTVRYSNVTQFSVVWLDLHSDLL